MKVKNLTGQRFGRLIANHRVGDSRYVGCSCDCGNSKTVREDHLLSGSTQSCGCLQSESRAIHTLKHGFNRKGKRASEYRSWVCMRERCNNPKNNEFHRYGARGIKVCDRWQNSFENFIADMGRKPLGYSIDRFPNQTGNYEPGNCRWADAKTQASNARSNKTVSAFGRSQLLVEWTDELGLNYKLIQGRLARGWNVERALTLPPDQTRVRKAA